MTQEKIFETKIKKFLEDYGKAQNKPIWFVKFWGGNLRTSSNNFIKTKPGTPDLLINCNGVFIGAEVKAEGGTPSDKQLIEIQAINKAGGIGVIVYPKDFNKFCVMIAKLMKDNRNIDEIRRAYYN